MIQAVIEIKGVKGNFTRANVNQVDSHRERLKLPPTTPGILVMNTLMGVGSLQEKDQPPHHGHHREGGCGSCATDPNT